MKEQPIVRDQDWPCRICDITETCIGNFASRRTLNSHLKKRATRKAEKITQDPQLRNTIMISLLSIYDGVNRNVERREGAAAALRREQEAAQAQHELQEILRQNELPIEIPPQQPLIAVFSRKAQCKTLAHHALCKIKFLYNNVGETKYFVSQ